MTVHHLSYYTLQELTLFFNTMLPSMGSPYYGVFVLVQVQYGKPVTLWCSDLFEDDNVYSIIPIQFVKSRAISLLLKASEYHESVLAVTPCVDF